MNGHAKYREDSEETNVNVDPKHNKLTMTWLVAAAVMLGAWNAGQYWARFTTKVDEHTTQIATVNDKVDKLIEKMDRRTEWQRETLMNIAAKVGATAPPLDAPPNQNP